MTPAQHIGEIGRRLFGEHWVGPLAQLAGVNRKTVARIRQAEDAGQDAAPALGVLFALEERLGAALVEVRRGLPS